tara:strand:- start:52 stop:825 length:774 start_codon:yes stop_codon:yes gene_type:complete
MDGMVVFHTLADDSYMNSVANFKGADVTSNTEITMYFGSASAQAGFGYDSVLLNITAGTEVAVMETIGAAMASPRRSGITVIADDINSKYVHDSITSCGNINIATNKSLVKTDVITAGRAITADESGTTFVLNVATADWTLPAASPGLNYKFILGIDPDASCSIGANSGDCFYGTVSVISSSADNTEVQHVTRAAAIAAPGNHDFLDFEHDTTTIGGKAGDIISIVADSGGGAGAWHVDAVLTMDGDPGTIAVINAG